MGRFANDESRSPLLNVVNWFLLVVVVLSVLTRLGIERWMFHRFTIDDYLIFLSMVGGDSTYAVHIDSHAYTTADLRARNRSFVSENQSPSPSL